MLSRLRGMEWVVHQLIFLLMAEFLPWKSIGSTSTPCGFSSPNEAKRGQVPPPHSSYPGRTRSLGLLGPPWPCAPTLTERMLEGARNRNSTQHGGGQVFAQATLELPLHEVITMEKKKGSLWRLLLVLTQSGRTRPTANFASNKLAESQPQCRGCISSSAGSEYILRFSSEVVNG